MRATAVTIVLVLANSLGGGLGPVIVGMLSDFFAARHFGDNFTQNCGAMPPHSHSNAAQRAPMARPRPWLQFRPLICGAARTTFWRQDISAMDLIT